MTVQDYSRHSLAALRGAGSPPDGPSALFPRPHAQAHANHAPHRHSLGALGAAEPTEKPSVLTRHESFQYTPSSQPRAPPPLRTAQSFSAPKSTPMVRKSSDKEDGEELTTKGRKRKRLAKACSACHKNKRRCDGFAPCSNCEFSSRPCLYLNAQGEPIPPPRTRDSSTVPNGRGSRDSGGASRDAADSKSGSFAHPDDRTLDRRILEPLDVVSRDPTLSLELIDAFLRRVHPFSSMIHAPTFYARLHANLVSPILLDMMQAHGAPFVHSPAFAGSFPPKTPLYARMEPFVERAHAAAERVLAYRRTRSENEVRADTGSWEETELAQACNLLSIYFCHARQTHLGLFYLDAVVAILRPGMDGRVPAPAPTAHVGGIGMSSGAAGAMGRADYATLVETRNRTFWIGAWYDMCAYGLGRPRRVAEHELAGVPLPGSEGWWTRYGGGGGGGEGKMRDGLRPRSGNWTGEEGEIGELGHALRIVQIVTHITRLAGRGPGGAGGGERGAGEGGEAPVQVHQEALKAWATDLPPHLRFDEHNLATATSKLASPLPFLAAEGWLYAYMHAVAECGMFYLQAAVALQPGSSWTAQRQGQAVENIAVILDAVGEKGRECPMNIFPLTVVTNWQDHLRSCGTAPSPAQLLLDERLDAWWVEQKRNWGLDRQKIVDEGFFPFDRFEAPPPAGVPLTPYTAPFQHSHAHEREGERGYGSMSAYGNDASARTPSTNSSSTFLRLLDPSPASAPAGRDYFHSYQRDREQRERVYSPPPTITDSTSSATWTLPPPTPGSLGLSRLNGASAQGSSTRTNAGALPPLRPRAASSAVPYPSLAARSPSPDLRRDRDRDGYPQPRRHLPSMSALSDRDGLHLPPLHELRNERGEFADREREREKGRYDLPFTPRSEGREVGGGSGSSVSAGLGLSGTSTSAGGAGTMTRRMWVEDDAPYATASARAPGHGRAAHSPASASTTTADREREREEQGFAALVSAAERRGAEEEEERRSASERASERASESGSGSGSGSGAGFSPVTKGTKATTPGSGSSDAGRRRRGVRDEDGEEHSPARGRGVDVDVSGTGRDERGLSPLSRA